MFNAIRKLFGREPKPPASTISPEELAAYTQGREVSKAQIAAVETYVDERYGQMRSAYLDVLQKQLDSCRAQDEHSPIMLARIEYSLYLDHVKEAQAKLNDEVRAVFSEWTALNKEMDVEELTDQWLDQTLTDKFADLSIDGLTVLNGNADIIKTADDNWRKRFPDRAAAQLLE
ncbi:hypothetical protein LJR098_001067 [Rhizobium sp. LjRoot98]|uniref:hypothetical protein n=1 Tax=Rhizobium sp. LjRoot98 TaxID=3342345 RepID=UPI003ECD8488